MCRFILGVLWLAVASVAVADEPKAETNKAAVAKAMESFTGAWEIAAVHPDGATKDARRLVFNKDGTYAAQDKDGKKLWAGTFEIDPTATPKIWDHRSHDAKKESKDVLGIYDLNGDKLKVACVAGQWKDKKWIGRSRPRAIDRKEADVVIEFKRAKRSSDTARLQHQLGDSIMIEQLPELAAGYVRTANGNDPAGFIALFDKDAVVDDAGRIIRGREEIHQWAASDIFAAKVTFDALDASENENGVTITAKVDGAFDRTGLPDPLIMMLEMVVRGGKITKLTCRLAKK